MKLAYKKLSKDFYDYFFGPDYYPTYNFHQYCKDNLTPFYIDFSWTINSNHFEYFDDKGIPIKKFVNFGKQYNPTRIAAYALLYWNKYIISKLSEDKNVFLKQVSWFVDNFETHNDISSWFYNFDYNEIKSPWVSCMAVGEAISVLTRAYKLTNDANYKSIIEKAIQIYYIDISEGGIKASFPDNTICFQEYPTIIPRSELNGTIYALFGLYDYCKYINPDDKKAQNLLKEALNSLKEHLPYYDNNKWSLYHYPVESIHNPATIYYHTLHIAQLEALHQLTNDPTFDLYVKKWKEYHKKFINRMFAMKDKLKYRKVYPAKH